MTCRTCGGLMEDRITDLPFKVAESSIVIVKGLPVIQCPNCNEYVLADAVMTHVEQILESADKTAELEVVRYAA
ncbi:MAG: YgiT-type zinc finger domain-containing protein [Deltaproteobacteria bacterium RBG_16_55_12]|nr:MAG: YgiT-type zinc finger domain-containing protein [Deltaproteobacteria bacterium RBG_16_55_12]